MDPCPICLRCLLTPVADVSLPAMKFRRWIVRLFLLSLLPLLLALLLILLLRPSPMERTEIYRGIFLTVEQLPDGIGMIAEVHWDTPGVRIEQRPFDFAFSPDNPVSNHFTLRFADYALFTEAPSLLMNTTRFIPHEPLQSYPGNGVRTLETLVINGRVSHIHEHSYLLYWDRAMNGYLSGNKPPDEETLARAWEGLGLQGIDLSFGSISSFSMRNPEEIYDRTFIGFNPEKKILYLLVLENVTRHYMALRALQAGATFGGQLDSGDSSHLLVGRGAKGLMPHGGIRNPRPLGPYLMIRANPLP